jgi:hypothetical protein
VLRSWTCEWREKGGKKKGKKREKKGKKRKEAAAQGWLSGGEEVVVK